MKKRKKGRRGKNEKNEDKWKKKNKKMKTNEKKGEKGEKGVPCSIMQFILLQHSHCTSVTILFKPFARLFINLAMRIRALFTKSATTLGLVEQAFWRVPPFTKWSGASSFEVILARQSRHSTTVTLASGTSGSRRISLISAV